MRISEEEARSEANTTRSKQSWEVTDGYIVAEAINKEAYEPRA